MIHVDVAEDGERSATFTRMHSPSQRSALNCHSPVAEVNALTGETTPTGDRCLCRVKDDDNDGDDDDEVRMDFFTPERHFCRFWAQMFSFYDVLIGATSSAGASGLAPW